MTLNELLQLGRDPQIAEIINRPPEEITEAGFNWAAILRSRKFRSWVASRFRSCLLQLGRDPQIAEMQHVDDGIRLNVGASIGPRSSDRGNRRGGTNPVPPLGASIGPRSSDRGNTQGRRGGLGCDAASIGPRSSDRGNGRGSGYVGRCVTRFNWAAILRSRKSSHAAARIRAAACFNWAAILRSRKCLAGPRLLARAKCFNWAAILRSRKWAETKRPRVIVVELQLGRDPQIAEIYRAKEAEGGTRRASIGPRSSDRGNPTPSRCVASGGFASIGPRSSDRGNVICESIRRECDSASIGPRSSDRGNGAGSGVRALHTPQLQLGRDPQIAEISSCRASPTALCALQLGRDPQIAEMEAFGERSRAHNMLQLGRDPQIAEIFDQAVTLSSKFELQLGRDPRSRKWMDRIHPRSIESRRFNWAAIADRGNCLPHVQPASAPGLASIGPRSADRGNSQACRCLVHARFNWAAIS